METLAERWRAVPLEDYADHYEVSDQGRVRRAQYAIRAQGTQPGQLLRPMLSNHGYRTVTLSKKSATFVIQVHVLVLLAFVGPRPPGHVCCHYDGDKTNNALPNLRWDSERANSLDAIRQGKSRAKLTPEQVREIRRKLRNRSCASLGREYGVEPATIVRLRAGKSWWHIPSEEAEAETSETKKTA